jgi:hypothetical protein
MNTLNFYKPEIIKRSWKMNYTAALRMICLLVAFTVPTWAQNGKGNKSGIAKCNPDCPLYTTAGTLQELDANELYWLSYMREEEKLALDVYETLYDQWGLRIFRNIAASEKRHFDAIGRLIARYGLEDPAQPDTGIFYNPDIQALYTDLIAEGELSIAYALGVGVKIEQKDIDDLVDAMNATDNKDILLVYANLLSGSENHLSAFSSHLEIAK